MLESSASDWLAQRQLTAQGAYWTLAIKLQAGSSQHIFFCEEEDFPLVLDHIRQFLAPVSWNYGIWSSLNPWSILSSGIS